MSKILVEAQAGNEKIAKNLIISGKGDINYVDNTTGLNALLYLLLNDQYKLAGLLLSHRGNEIDLNLQEPKDGYTALHIAIKSLHAQKNKIIKLLILKGANRGILNKNGVTALMYAASSSPFAVKELLLQDELEGYDGCRAGQQSKLGQTALMFSLYRHRYLDNIQLFVDHDKAMGQNLSHPEYQIQNGMTILMMLFKSDHTTKKQKELYYERLILDTGYGCINCQSDTGKTALMFYLGATGWYHIIPNFIFDYSPNLRLRDKEGDTVLMYAIKAKHIRMIRKFIDICPDLLKIRNNKGMYPIMYSLAPTSSYPLKESAIIKYLLRDDLLDIRDRSGRHLLHYVMSMNMDLLTSLIMKKYVVRNNLYTITLFLYFKMKGLKLLEKYSKFPIDYKLVLGIMINNPQQSYDIYDYLNRKLDLSLPIYQGATPLIYSLTGPNIKEESALNLLKTKNANPGFIYNGTTALIEAVKKDYVNVVKELLKMDLYGGINIEINYKSPWKYTARDIAYNNSLAPEEGEIGTYEVFRRYDNTKMKLGMRLQRGVKKEMSKEGRYLKHGYHMEKDERESCILKAKENIGNMNNDELKKFVRIYSGEYNIGEERKVKFSCLFDRKSMLECAWKAIIRMDPDALRRFSK